MNQLNKPFHFSCATKEEIPTNEYATTLLIKPDIVLCDHEN